jgi:hypothetical protein
MEVYKGKSPEQGMRAEIVYMGGKSKELVHGIGVYPDFYTCIIANPWRKENITYLRTVELKQKPIPRIITRMFRETPFGYSSQRGAVILPKDIEFRYIIHPLLLEPFPDELSKIKDEILMRRKTGEKEFIYECILKEVGELEFPLITEYSIEVNGEKENFRLKNMIKRGTSSLRCKGDE